MRIVSEYSRHVMRASRLALAFVVLNLAVMNVRAEGYDLAIVASSNGFHGEVASALQERAEEHGLSTFHKVGDLSDDDIAEIRRASLRITIGSTAADKLSRAGIEGRQLQISGRAQRSELPSVGHLNLSADDCNNVLLIDALGDFERVGVITTKESIDRVTSVVRCGIEHGIKITVYPMSESEDLIAVLEEVIAEVDVLLAVPDPSVYNRNTVKNILLMSYRARKPVIGFSESFINAGALAGTFITPEIIADEAMSLIESYFDNGRRFEERSVTPTGFKVAVNHQVVKSFDIEVPYATVLRSKILRMRSE